MLEMFRPEIELVKTNLTNENNHSVDVFEVIDSETDLVSSFAFISPQPEGDAITSVYLSYTLEGDVRLYAIINERLVNVTDKVLLHANILSMEALRDNVSLLGTDKGYSKTKEVGYL